MSTTKHTPAPWNIQSGAYNSRIITYSDGNLRSHVATLHDGALCEEHGSIDANARLIAAAPELLEALQLCENVIGMAMLEKKLSDNVFSPQWEAVDKARAAIAKAKGE